MSQSQRSAWQVIKRRSVLLAQVTLAAPESSTMGVCSLLPVSALKTFTVRSAQTHATKISLPTTAYKADDKSVLQHNSLSPNTLNLHKLVLEAKGYSMLAAKEIKTLDWKQS